MPRFQKGDWVTWVGGSYQNLKGIVIDTRTGTGIARLEVKVIWDGKGLGSLKQKAGGSWQRASCLEILSSISSPEIFDSTGETE
tara:strand:- start:894 stop:1145 length:252 start_codon:yes stop_codon:yes gene_type:complete